MKYILILSLIIFSCSPSAKLRRAERLIKQAEASGLEWHSDTLYTTLEIPVPEVSVDTIFQPTPGDTVKIQEERLRIEYVQIPGGKVYIKGECEADTIFKEVPVIVNKEISCPPQGWSLKQILIICVITIVALLIGRIIRI